jgi:hypothetical protein
MPQAPGATGWWNSDTKTLRCVVCGPASDDQREAVTSGPTSNAGASAQRKYERLKAKREDMTLARHPRVGRVLLAVTDEPPSTKAWARGAQGERHLGAQLDTLAGPAVAVLHDRRIPCSRANIDHLVIAPSGLWIIDAKLYRGEVTKRDVGGWFRSDERLYVGGRDRSALVAGVSKQVIATTKALGETFADLTILPVLCFVDSEWPFFAKPFSVNGVLVCWPAALLKLITARLPTAISVTQVAARLNNTLPPAT